MARRLRLRRTLVAATFAAALTAGLLASPAAAFHIPGADYSGYASGGGTITFSVSKDGSAVTNLTLNGPIEINSCTLGTTHYDQPIPIKRNSFDNGQVSGGFPNVRGAYGRFNIPGSRDPLSNLTSSCRVAGTWSAITGADPSGSKECKQARRKAKRRKRALSRAKRSGNASAIKKARGRWEKARSKRDQFC